MSGPSLALQQATIHNYAKQLRLPVLGGQFARLAEEAIKQKQSHVSYLEAILAAELEEREHNTVTRRLPLEDIVGSMNASLRGWANYFHYRNSSGVLEKVRTHAEERLRTHLMQRHKVKDRGVGLGRFPSQQLYMKYGLYKVPTTAGWKSAHALA